MALTRLPNGSLHPRRTRQAWQSRTSTHAYVKSEPEEDWFLLGVQKPEPSNVFDFLEPPLRWRWPEWNTRLPKAIICPMKTDRSSFKNSNCLPVPVMLMTCSATLARSKSMQGSVRGDAELTLSPSNEGDSMLEVLATFPQPTSHFRQRPNAGGSQSLLDRHKPFVPPVRWGHVVLYRIRS
ncbi:hypothetical protein K443DRAFT_682428 [Laccaria amethystina LaAM-08-1]|uniref:Uncharacterized protein n=1 Tax=Laccaria amethystina LaAM-08-1 TaxID=1095629 RepID=A0A0C9WV37_9AGAR|nr:hypothetical protein K443DRAFT_682428 [Laccaria amethystina LaAM-08-1]